MRTYSRKKVEYQMIEGVKELCRLCLEKCKEIVPIFTDNSDVCAALPMRIMICVGLEVVREDCLPNMICQTCYKELERYYSFRKKCEVTYQKLKAHVLALKEQEAIRPKPEIKEVVQERSRGQDVEINLQNGDVDGQLVLALNENEQLELVNVVGLNGVVQVCEKQDDQSRSQVLQQCIENEIQNQVDLSSNQVLQQSIENEIQMQDISTTSPQSTETAEQVDMSLLLPTILIRLGILSQQAEVVQLVDRDFQELELEGGGGERIVLELIEEDDNSTTTSTPPSIQEANWCNAQGTKDSTNLVSLKVDPPSAFKPMIVRTKPKKTKKRPPRASGQAQSGNNPASGKNGTWCDTCGKVFSTRSVLARHKRTHSAARPYACSTCGRMFTQRSVLTRHELVHSAERPYKCAECPKSFTQRASLEAHARTHAPPHARPLALHLCSNCPKVFLYPSGLSRHMSVHDGRIFKCDDCSRQFRDRSSLMRHLKTANHQGKDS